MPATAACRLALLLISLGLVACGFRLAGTAELPAVLQRVDLETRNFSDRQRKALRRQLQNAGAVLSAEADSGAARLRVSMLDTAPQTLVTSGSSGKTVERLTRSLSFSLQDAAGKTLVASKTLTQRQDIKLDEDNLLSSNEEKASLALELEKSLFNALIFQLGRI